jgi:RNA polymerase sigma factor (sigma-70 family)
MNQLPNTTLEELARRAVNGDREAVQELVRALQGDIYRLALRMLWNPADAEDATQEILVRVVTRLAQFDSKSQLRTWVFRVATNYLLDVKKSATERLQLSFVRLGEDLEEGLSSEGPADAEHSLLTVEVKIGCTMAMLQCLDRPHRIAYVLGEALELPMAEAAEALGIEEAAFRKRLERARERVWSFTRAHCGLVSETAACQCNRRVPPAVKLGRVQPESLQFASEPCSFEEARRLVRRVEGARRALELYRVHGPKDSSVDFARHVASALDTRS